MAKLCTSVPAAVFALEGHSSHSISCKFVICWLDTFTASGCILKRDRQPLPYSPPTLRMELDVASSPVD